MSAALGKFFMLLKPNLNRKKRKEKEEKRRKEKKEKEKKRGGEGRREKRRGEISVLLMVYLDLAILLVWQVTSIQQGNAKEKSIEIDTGTCDPNFHQCSTYYDCF